MKGLAMNKKNFISIRFLILNIIILCYICGCAEKNEESLESIEKASKVDLVEIQWKDYEKMNKNDLKENEVSYIEVFKRDASEDIRWGDYFETIQKDEIIYLQHFYTLEDSVVQYGYLFQIYNTVTGHKKENYLDDYSLAESVRSIYSDETRILTDFKNGYLRVIGLDVTDDKIKILWALFGEEWQIDNCFVSELDEDGQILMTNRISEELWTNRIDEDELYVPLFGCGNNGLLYYYDEFKTSSLYILNEKGEIQNEISLNDLGKGKLYRSCKTDEGDCVFQHLDERGNVCVFTVNDGQRKDLYKGKHNVLRAEWDDIGGITFLDTKKLLYWKVREGECQILCELDGIDKDDCQALATNSQGEWIILMDDKIRVHAYVIKQGIPSETKVLQMLQMDAVDEYPKTCAANYSRMNPNVRIDVNIINNNEPSKRLGELNTLVEKMKAGEGPDILLVSREEMGILQAAGCLEPVEEVLTNELKDIIFDGVLRYGSIDGVRYGIPYEAHVGTMFVNSEKWSDNHWTLKQLMDTWDQLEKNGNAPRRLESIYYAANPWQILHDICVQTIGNSPFVDWKNKKSSFDSEEFIKLLEFCKNRGEDENSTGYLSADEMYQEVISGEAMTMNVSGNFLEFSQSMAALDEKCHIVGFPVEQGNGGMVYSYRMLVVNKWSNHKDIVIDFLRNVLSEDNQVKYTNYWVRKDIFMAHIKEHTELADGPIILLDGYGYTELAGRNDGTSYLQEYMDILENGDVLGTNDTIGNIILEEAGAYFENSKSAKDVANIIQNRVQLYFDEQK